MNGQYAIQIYNKETGALDTTLGNEKLIPQIMYGVQFDRVAELTNHNYGSSSFKLVQLYLKRITLSFADSEESYLILYSRLQTAYAVQLCYVILYNFHYVDDSQLMMESIAQALNQILRGLYLQGQIHYIQLINHEEEQKMPLVEYMKSDGCQRADLFLTKNKRLLIYRVSNCTVLLYLNRKQQMDEYGSSGSMGWIRNEATCDLIVQCVNEASGVLISYGVDPSNL